MHVLGCLSNLRYAVFMNDANVKFKIDNIYFIFDKSKVVRRKVW